MAEVQSVALAAALRRNRDRFNALLAAACGPRSRLDVRAFKESLTAGLGPVLDAVAAKAPDRADAVAQALYALTLDLMARGVLGPASRRPGIEAGFWKIMAAGPTLLAEDPRRFAGSVVNALHHLTEDPRDHAAAWADGMARMAPCCPDVGRFLAVGTVVAWRAGLAHLRRHSLAVLAGLDEAFACASLGIPPRPVGPVLERLKSDPWFDPASDKARSLAVAAAAGGFAGFGGPFRKPPLVRACGGRFLVSDDSETWELFADRFGATLRRWRGPVPEADRPDPELAIDPKGRVRSRQAAADFPALARSTSTASTGATLAVTVRNSHKVFLLALA